MGHARRIVMFNWVTADGYFAAPDGNLDWVVPDEDQAQAAFVAEPGQNKRLSSMGWGLALALPAALADIDIDKGRSVYYVRRLGHRRLSKLTGTAEDISSFDTVLFGR